MIGSVVATLRSVTLTFRFRAGRAPSGSIPLDLSTTIGSGGLTDAKPKRTLTRKSLQPFQWRAGLTTNSKLRSS